MGENGEHLELGLHLARGWIAHGLGAHAHLAPLEVKLKVGHALDFGLGEVVLRDLAGFPKPMNGPCLPLSNLSASSSFSVMPKYSRMSGVMRRNVLFPMGRIWTV